MKDKKIISSLLVTLFCALLLCGCVRQKPEDGSEFSEHSELGIEKKERRKDTSEPSAPADSSEGQDEKENADVSDTSVPTKK